MKTRLSAFSLSALVLAAPGLAQATNHAAPQSASQAARPAGALVEGEVRKVDKDTGKITLRHGAIVNLDMPPMTMVFQVKDPTLLDTVKAGDKIRFAAGKAGGAYTVTRLESAK